MFYKRTPHVITAALLLVSCALAAMPSGDGGSMYSGGEGKKTDKLGAGAAPKMAPMGSGAPAPQVDAMAAAAPALATLSAAIDKLGKSAAAAPALSQGLAMLGKLAASADSQQINRVRDALSALQDSADKVAEEANPSVRSLVGAIGATTEAMQGTGESNAPVLGEAMGAPATAPSPSASFAGMSAADAAAATAALLPAALSVINAASQFSESDASALTKMLQAAFNSADGSNPAAQALSAISALSALAPAASPAAAARLEGSEDLSAIIPDVKAEPIPDMDAQISELEIKAAAAPADQKQDAEDALKLAKMVQAQQKAAQQYAPIAGQIQGYLNKFADAFKQASEMPLSEAELAEPKLETMATREQLKELSEAVAAEQSKATGAPVAAPADFSNLKPLLGLSSPEWIKAGRRIAKALEIMNAEMGASAPAGAPAGAPAPAGAMSGEPAPAAMDIAGAVNVGSRDRAPDLPALSDIIAALQSLAKTVLGAAAASPAMAPAMAAAAGAAAPAAGPALAAAAAAAPAAAAAIANVFASMEKSGQNPLEALMPLIASAGKAFSAIVAASPAGAPAASPAGAPAPSASADAATTAVTDFARQLSAVSKKMTADSMPEWARANFLAAMEKDDAKMEAERAAAGPMPPIDTAAIMGVMTSFAQQLSELSIAATAASLPDWAKDNFMLAHAQDKLRTAAGLGAPAPAPSRK